MNIQLLPCSAVRPSTYNPRVADPERMALVELSLRKLGFLLPLCADPCGELLSGHQRLTIAERMGITRVPVSFSRPMELPERQAVNIAFNRGTNDLQPWNTPKNLTEALKQSNIDILAQKLPDLDVNSDAFYPCIRLQRRPVERLIHANKGNWIPYARSISKTLMAKKVFMPVVVDSCDHVLNGLGRLEVHAESGTEEIDVVVVQGSERADLAKLLLNLLSMDFDLHNRYADLLRYNSFRRARRVRDGLGRGFVFAVQGDRPANTFSMHNPKHRARWKAVHGESVVDFGAGHMTETELLRAGGVRVTPFEPYRLGTDGQINKAESIELARAFLADVTRGVEWSSIFISSVLNSVPFVQDRRHIVTIAAALCGPSTRVYAVASSVKQVGWESANGRSYANETASRSLGFVLPYEPGICLGDISKLPKVQKYHTAAEFRELFSERFESVDVHQCSDNNVEAICADPRTLNFPGLIRALEFEFNLPYPDGSRMDLVQEAKAAFEMRLGVAL